jgi:ubiquinone/menaquinone biosynthesis C-methylase UbiE
MVLQDIFKALSDEVRLRIVRAVGTAELSVAELVSVLGLPQSTVSRHLKPLRDRELVESRRDGTSVYYRTGPALEQVHLTQLLEEQLDEVPHNAEDRASIRRVLDLRRQKSREFFEQIAGTYGMLAEPGGGWQVLAHALALGFEGRDVADLGAGEGHLTLLLSRFAKKVTAVDLSPKMLELIMASAKDMGTVESVRVAEGDLEQLPLDDESVDAAFLSQALHHAARPAVAISEAARILRPGGTLVVLDLLSHEQEWLREQWADQWLGFKEEQLQHWMDQAGLEPVCAEQIPGSMPELSVLLMMAKKK